ncbi:hypothetical protein DSO57_1002938 [Entomophthora muscae]|uniref:Uncharacterized protein n=1 Tax=Entomophthora muscae TaxID=34485 RepID=A0ACC2T8I6_9FUNG|nr:hypothetical protein DSO57_1002938 [Entomophthora muscae]
MSSRQPDPFKNPKLGRRGKAWLTMIVTTPFMIVISYELYQRIFCGKERNILRPEDKIDFIRRVK